MLQRDLKDRTICLNNIEDLITLKSIALDRAHWINFVHVYVKILVRVILCTCMSICVRVRTACVILSSHITCYVTILQGDQKEALCVIVMCAACIVMYCRMICAIVVCTKHHINLNCISHFIINYISYLDLQSSYCWVLTCNSGSTIMLFLYWFLLPLLLFWSLLLLYCCCCNCCFCCCFGCCSFDQKHFKS